MGRALQDTQIETLTLSEWNSAVMALSGAIIKAGVPLAEARVVLSPALWAEAQQLTSRHFSCWPYRVENQFQYLGVTFCRATDAAKQA